MISFTEKLYPDGTVFYRYPVLNGEKHGEYTKFHSNKKLAELGVYKNGVQVDNMMSWYPNGYLQRFASLDNNGNIHGIEILYHDNGCIKRVSFYVHGDMHGNVYHYSITKSLYKTERYHYGLNVDHEWIF